jgi:hypothetical protein
VQIKVKNNHKLSRKCEFWICICTLVEGQADGSRQKISGLLHLICDCYGHFFGNSLMVNRKICHPCFGCVPVSASPGGVGRGEQGVTPGVYESPFPSPDSPYSISSASTIDPSHASVAAHNNSIRHDATVCIGPSERGGHFRLAQPIRTNAFGHP